jgi:hypothetical protein
MVLMKSALGRKVSLLVASLVLLALMIAAAAALGPSRAGPVGDFRLSPLPGPVTYEGGTIRLEVPDPTMNPQVTPAQALDTYRKEGAPPELVPVGPAHGPAKDASNPKCDAIQIINASTGAFILAIQTCEHVTK